MGTKFSLKDPNPGVWFTFDPEDPESGRICLRVLNGAKLREIAQLTKKWEWKDGKKVQAAPDFWDAERAKLSWEYTIVAWEKLEDDDGKPIECTAENKFELMNTRPDFSAWVNGCLSVLNKELEELGEKVAKN